MRKGSKRLSTVLASILIISIGMTLLIFRTDVQAAIFGTKYYYLSLERDNFKKLGKIYKDNYKEKYLSELSYACKANALFDGDLIKSDPDMKQLADIISKFELNINYNANNKDLKNAYYTALIDTKYDNKKLLAVDLKGADNKALIAFPELTEKILSMESSDKAYKFTEAFMGDKNAFRELFGLTRQAYDELLEKYLKDVIFGQIPDEAVVFNNDASFENIKCNSITFNIDEKIISKIYKAVAKELSNDQEIPILVKYATNSFLKIANEQQQTPIKAPTPEEIYDAIQELCDELNDEAEYMEEVQYEYTAYFENNGDIISRQFKDKLSDTSAKLSNFKDISGTDIFNLKVNESENTIFELTNKANLQNGIYDGKFTFDLTGKSLIAAQYSFEKDAKIGNIDAFVGELQGKINLKQFNDSEINNYIDLNDIYFSFINQKKDNNTLLGKTKVTSNVDGKRAGITIFTEVMQSNTANIIKPEVDADNSIKLTDTTELNEMGTEIFENLQERLSGIFPLPSFEDESNQVWDDEIIQ